jgi:hypothetical protein
MKCKGSGTTKEVSPHERALRYSKCPICNCKVDITIPERKGYSLVGKIKNHSNDS